MRIDIVVTDWEQECCGEEATVGERATFNIYAEDPTLPQPGAQLTSGNPRYIEEHHGQTPAHVPHYEVDGIVQEIVAMTYPKTIDWEKATGTGSIVTVDTEHPKFRPLEHLDARTEQGANQYVVTLEVDDAIQLPSFVAWASRDD